ncbi:chorismate synthase [Candidatus Peregrinibacteria bacterium]|nr:MAG: chorismate synthase [Candidatus Peregrinibacteria bacterium]
MNTFGTHFRLTTFGESHGIALGAVIDGCPAGLLISVEEITTELARRRPGQSDMATPRNESDTPEILSGIFEGKTIGTPIAIIVRNSDQKSKDYSVLKEVFRPGHADEVWDQKYQHRDHRGGGRQSGRETLSRVIGGAIAKKLLKTASKTEIFAHVVQLGNIRAETFQKEEIEKNLIRCGDAKAAQKMEELVRQTKQEGDSLGALVEIVVKNPPKLCGSPVFGKIEGEFAKALLSIGTTRSFEFGEGLQVAHRFGSEQNPKQEGISGGITTGETIRLRVAIKPPPSIGKAQKMKKSEGGTIETSVTGRHDPTIAPRFVPVAESMIALVLADALLAPPERTNLLFRTS